MGTITPPPVQIWLNRVCHGVFQIWAPIYSGTVMKYVANNDFTGFVIGICHLWAATPYWKIPNDYDKPLFCKWLMKYPVYFLTNERPWNWSCVTFSANHKARFQNLFNLKGYPLQKIYMGFVIYGWGVSVFIRDIFHHSTWVYRSPYLTNPTHIWQTPLKFSKQG